MQGDVTLPQQPGPQTHPTATPFTDTRDGSFLLGAGCPVVSLRFLDLLSDLAPSSPRLALAMASAQPWRDCAAELPKCYRVELDHAGWVAHAEHDAWHARGRPGEGGPGTPIIGLGPPVR